MTNPDRPTILVLGSTGQTGRLVVEELDRYPDAVQIRLCSRRREEAERLQSQGREAVFLDLDDPRTFGEALAGVERIYLLTGYTVAMLVQSKTLVDAAIKAGVQHIVHQGIFGQWDCTDPHFAWHQMIERYIEASGISWTHLQGNPEPRTVATSSNVLAPPKTCPIVNKKLYSWSINARADIEWLG